MLAWIIGAALVSTVMERGTPRTREVDIADGKFSHTESVIGELNAETTLEFPSPVTLLRCSDCDVIGVKTDAQDAEENISTGHNWTVSEDRKTHPGYVHLMPAELPSRDNPVAAFNATVTVVLASRHKINIQLSLRDPRAGRGPYDHWVEFQIPGHERISAQIKAEVDKIAQTLKHSSDGVVATTVAKLFLRRPQCSALSWLIPEVETRTRVWVTDVCVTRDEPFAYAVRFAVENAKADLAIITEAKLEPQGDWSSEGDPKVYQYFPKAPIAHRQHVFATAIYQVPKGDRQPPSWSLRVSLASRPDVVVDNISFGQ